MGLPSSSRYGTRIDWVALHSAEGARTVGSLYNFFNEGQHASSHAGADGYQLSEPWVPDERAAWTLLNGNPRSLNLEMCGFARWTREQWLSTGWVDGVWNPRQMIRHAAQWTREKCDRHNVPKRLLTSAQVANGERGIIDHFRYTVGKKDGDHTDVGTNYPFDVFMSDVLGTGSGADDVSAEEVKWNLVAFRPNRGQNLWDGLEQIQLNQAAQNATLAAIAADRNVTPDALNRMINQAVEANRVKPADVAAALSGTLLPLVEEALRRVQDTDNVDEAKQTARELLQMIASVAPSDQE